MIGPIIAAALALLLEILKLYREAKNAHTEQQKEIIKQQTESVQAIARGVIDGDESRINDHFDRLRRLREKK